MGGIGSGNWYRWCKRDTVEDYRSIDIRRWQREGLLMPGHWFGWQWTRNGGTVASIQVRMETDRVILSYRHRSSGEEGKDERYPVRLDWTPCTYGGRRAWFICSARGCGRRVAILYLGGRYFACRHCYGLAYASQNENAAGRALLKAQRLRMKLGGSASLAEAFPEKPKGMHWRTYERVQAQAEEAEAQSLAMLADKLLRWRERLA